MIAEAQLQMCIRPPVDVYCAGDPGSTPALSRLEDWPQEAFGAHLALKQTLAVLQPWAETRPGWVPVTRPGLFPQSSEAFLMVDADTCVRSCHTVLRALSPHPTGQSLG